MNSVKIEVLSQIQNMFTGGPFSNRGSGKVGSVPSRSLAQGRCGWIPPSYSTWLRNLHQQGHVTGSRLTVPADYRGPGKI